MPQANHGLARELRPGNAHGVQPFAAWFLPAAFGMFPLLPSRHPHLPFSEPATSIGFSSRDRPAGRRSHPCAPVDFRSRIARWRLSDPVGAAAPGDRRPSRPIAAVHFGFWVFSPRASRALPVEDRLLEIDRRRAKPQLPWAFPLAGFRTRLVGRGTPSCAFDGPSVDARSNRAPAIGLRKSRSIQASIPLLAFFGDMRLRQPLCGT
jgi:hypothetical protein